MRRIITLLLTLVLLLGAPALAQQDEALMEAAKSALTETLGYTAQEADRFVFEIKEESSHWQVRFYPPEHPDWVYSMDVAKNGFGQSNWVLPFDTTGGRYSGYPGQNAVQDVLRTARENGWFTRWDENAMAAFSQKLLECGVRPTAELGRGLSTGEVSAAQAVDGFFRSCYGEPREWTPALSQWRDEVLAQNSLTLETARILPVTPGMQTYQRENFSGSGGQPLETLTVTEFSGQVPEELAGALAHPKLEGWKPLCGAYYRLAASQENPFSRESAGFVAFEREDGQRLLVMLTADSGEESWRLLPVGEKALLTGREMRIVYDGARNEFVLEYPISEVECKRFFIRGAATALPGGRLCRLGSYERSNVQTGEGVVINGESRDADACWFHVTTYAQGQPAREETFSKLVPGYLDFIDAQAFPKSAEECAAWADSPLPQGYGVSSGVHLRKKTSSRSADLGEYHRGTLVQVLEVLPGNPDSWVHVKVGQTEGYMSGVYVDYPGTECSMKPLEMFSPLPVAMAQRELELKTGTGWLDGKTADLPAGTKMHVLAVSGDWLHVMVPTGEAGWLMDVNGTSGYVKAADVVQAATALQLDWLP